MLMQNISLLSLSRASAFAFVAASLIAATGPAAAASADAPSIRHAATVSATDISAARRQHQARHSSPRNAYGSYVGGAGGYATPSSGYGYGYGDNSHNQTW